MAKQHYKVALDLLQRALDVEYQFITHYPHLAMMLHDEEMVSELQTLGEDSIKHADIVANAITKLGGVPSIPIIAALPESMDLKEFFHKQLELEKEAYSLHTQAAENIGKELEYSFREIAE